MAEEREVDEADGALVQVHDGADVQRPAVRGSILVPNPRTIPLDATNSAAAASRPNPSQAPPAAKAATSSRLVHSM
ncbi:MAG TPA: hypothetical protein VN033_01075 [Vulgatibacter sp.]|nr:hypothetical protein [Vulgatibacter sp.]